MMENYFITSWNQEKLLFLAPSLLIDFRENHELSENQLSLKNCLVESLLDPAESSTLFLSLKKRKEK